MSSWQARLVSLALRTHIKRRQGLTRVDVAEARALLGVPRWPRDRVPAGLAARPAVVGGVEGEWIERAGGLRQAAVGPRVVLYLHGGGYFLSSPRAHRPLTTAFARAARARVFAPDYRLAPEHPFPAALDDALAAYRGLLALGIPASRIIVAGDSAGGGLALALLVAAREAGLPRAAAAVCFSPWTDLACTGGTLVANDARCAMFRGAAVPLWARLYLGATEPTHPLASPLYADLRGLPPLLLHASASEVLLDDTLRFARRARAAGVPVELALWDDVPHVWQMWWRVLPEARESLAGVARFIDARLGAAHAHGVTGETPNGTRPRHAPRIRPAGPRVRRSARH